MVTSIPAPYSWTVRNDYDVVAMRQEVRQQARLLGLGLIQQAKIASAISAVARAVNLVQTSTTFTMQTTVTSRPAYEIVCAVPLTDRVIEAGTLEQTLHLDEARLLVDEANIVQNNDVVQLILRVWLGTV